MLKLIRIMLNWVVDIQPTGLFHELDGDGWMNSFIDGQFILSWFLFFLSSLSVYRKVGWESWTGNDISLMRYNGFFIFWFSIIQWQRYHISCSDTFVIIATLPSHSICFQVASCVHQNYLLDSLLYFYEEWRGR